MSSDPVDFSVVTITYNEAEVITSFLDAVASALRPLKRSFEIIVVDDESPDGTARVVEQKALSLPEVRLVVRRGERGIGSAYLHGIRASRGRFVSTMDADFSHPPDRLPALFATAEEGTLALGSRFLRPGDFQTHAIRSVVTGSINAWHRIFLATGVKDHTNGFLAVSRETLDRLLESSGRAGMEPFGRILYQLPLVVAARREGIPIREIEARYIFRQTGETKIPFLRGVRLLGEEWWDSVRLFPHRRR